MQDLYTFDKSMVVSRLHRWARWRFDSKKSGGYPSKAAFMRLAPSDPSRIFNDVDSECIETNAAVEMLPWFSRDVIHAEYLSSGLTAAGKAMMCGTTRDYYFKCLKAAHENVAKILNSGLHVRDGFGINVLCG